MTPILHRHYTHHRDKYPNFTLWKSPRKDLTFTQPEKIKSPNIYLTIKETKRKQNKTLLTLYLLLLLFCLSLLF